MEFGSLRSGHAERQPLRLLPARLLVGAAIAAAALLSAACGGGYKPVRMDSGLAAMVPPDTVLLAGIRLEELRATTLYRRLTAHRPSSGFDSMGRDTGLDFDRDVREVLVASNGADLALLARGSFQSLQPPAGGSKSGYRGRTLFHKGSGAYALLDAQTAVAGSIPAIRRVLDQKDDPSSGARDLIRRADSLPLSGQIWAVLNRPSDLLRQLPKDGNMANLDRFVRTVESASLAADFRNGFTARVSGVCRSDQDAKTLGDALRGLLGLARLGVPAGQPARLKLFDGIKVTQEKTAVSLSVDIPAELAGELSGLVP